MIMAIYIIKDLRPLKKSVKGNLARLILGDYCWTMERGAPEIQRYSTNDKTRKNSKLETSKICSYLVIYYIRCNDCLSKKFQINMWMVFAKLTF